ncbi:MAG: tRNA (adenosine(37)-N6)-threonylcarbamoyltransferase complex dimerization subunit type 1 TsaB [Betaproteobacteria bacterium]
MLLSIDTSTSQSGLALYDGAQVLAELLWHSRAHHTQELAPALAGLLERTGAKIDEVKAVGVAIGPGSFTSLRVGLSFAKGLVLARKLPLVGIPTLDIVAAAQPISKVQLAVVLQAGRGRLALGNFEWSGSGWKSKGELTVTTADALVDSIQVPVIVCGELTADERQRLRKNKNALLASPAACARRPGILAELAWRRWQAGKMDNPASLAPIYLHVAEPIPS